MAFIVKTFGIENIRRDQVIARGPRFHIGFDANAADKVGVTAQNLSPNKQQLQKNTGVRAFGGGYEATALFKPDEYKIDRSKTLGGSAYNTPQSSGRYEMMRCKVDSVSLGVMPGRRVAAVRWEGVSEGITYHLDTIQTFKNQVTSNTFENAQGANARVPSTATSARR